MSEAVIEVRGLRNVFGTQVVHEGLDLDVYRGEVLGVIGGSGAGKSVLLRSILGLKQPDGGRVLLFGQDVTDLDADARKSFDRRIGLLFQDGALFSSLTVLENVKVPLLEYYALPADAINKLPSQLSGGMRKRAALARALALDPALLFLDEPTAGLDPIGAAAFDELIRTLQRSLGLTVFLITHDLDTLYAICDRVAVLADKKVLINAPLAEVEKFDHPWVQEYFHGPRGRAAQVAQAKPE